MNCGARANARYRRPLPPPVADSARAEIARAASRRRGRWWGRLAGRRLHGPDEEQALLGGKVVGERGDEVVGVDGDVDEDVEHGERAAIDRDETRVPIVHEEVRAERTRGEVVDAARAVRHVAEHHALHDREARDHVRERASEHLESFRELQRHGLCTRSARVSSLRSGPCTPNLCRCGTPGYLDSHLATERGVARTFALASRARHTVLWTSKL